MRGEGREGKGERKGERGGGGREGGRIAHCRGRYGGMKPNLLHGFEVHGSLNDLVVVWDLLGCHRVLERPGLEREVLVSGHYTT